MKKKIVIICIILVCIFLFTCVLVPAIAILGEALFVRWDIDNPYVNNNYYGWNYAYVEGFSTFLIPKEWSLEKDEDIYWIIDESGKVWAFGAPYGTEADAFSDYAALIEKACSVHVSDMTIDSYPRFYMMDGSDVDRLLVRQDSLTKEYYCIQMLETAQEEIVWILFHDISVNEDQYDIMEAIVYSFAFEIKVSLNRNGAE